MKTRILMLTLLALGSFFAQAQEAESAGNPKLEFEKSTHDFGDIEKGKKVNTTFKFKNTGSKSLEIMNVATSCGCTSAKPEKTTYQPGESGEIPVTFDPSRFSGKITKRITVTTNDTRSPKTVVTIKGNVVVDVLSKPVSVFFTSAKVGEKSTKEISLSTTKLPKLEISDIKAHPEFLSVKEERVDDKNIKLVLTADGTKFPEGKSRLSGYVTYNTNSESQKSMRTTVTVNIERPVQVTPNSVYFFASKAGKKRETFLRLKSNSNKTFNVEDLKSDLEFVEVKVSEDNGANKTLVVTLSDKAPEGKFQGTLSMKTNIDAQSSVSIPVRGSVIK